MAQVQAQQDLRQFVPLGGELVRNLARREKLLLLELIDASGAEQQVGDLVPIHRGVRTHRGAKTGLLLHCCRYVSAFAVQT
jgi:hypothetical protein